MKAAINEGNKARLLSPPNPWVGCVLVKNGAIVASGHTQPPGLDHAEASALRLAPKEDIAGAVAYVTLEPCCHFGKTPPCTRALIAAQIKKVVIALEDPDPLVSGKGIKELRQAGITVEIGVCAHLAEESLRPYLHHRKTKKAYCLIKTAVSADGKIAAKDGTSQWITSKEARLDAHVLRSFSQGIMIGSETAILDSPSLTVREVPKPHTSPLRILFDRRGRVPPIGPLFDASLANTLILTTTDCPDLRKEEWQKKGARVKTVEKEESFESVLSYLGSIGIVQLMIEGGAHLQSAVLSQKACEELIVYTGSLILGDEGLQAFKHQEITTMKEALRLHLTHVRKLGNSVRSDYLITKDEQ